MSVITLKQALDQGVSSSSILATATWNFKQSKICEQDKDEQGAKRFFGQSQELFKVGKALKKKGK